MSPEKWHNTKPTDQLNRERNGGTGSMLQNSASMLAEQGQAADPVRKQIGKAKQEKHPGK